MQLDFGLDIPNTTPIFTVSEITEVIKGLLETQVGTVVVRGEITNFRPAPSGHLYFALKDTTATISAAIFRNSLSRLRNIRIENGIEVICTGKISVYSPRGTYQLIIETMEAVGAGSLQAQFEALKKKLLEEGLFASERKRPLPKLPRKIAVVTSPTGAAIRDVLSVLTRRNAGVEIIIVPALVQGQGAERELVVGLAQANDERLGADVILLTRGGGSLEDLWSFNSEVLARAIYKSRLPVVSAVGHEIDFTIADFVADLRAPTPSAAAEILVQEKDLLIENIVELRRRLQKNIASIIQNWKLELDGVVGRLKNPRDRITELRLRFDEWTERLVQAMRTHISSLSTEEWPEKLANGIRQLLKQKQDRLKNVETALVALSPLQVLERGYSLVYKEDGALLKDAEQATIGAGIHVQLAKGKLVAKVLEKF